MNTLKTSPVLIAVLALALPWTVRPNDGGTSNRPDNIVALEDVIVNFGDPVTLVGTGNEVLVPDDTTVRKDGSVAFIVNGPGHGIAIYPVSKNTTREDITAQLCSHDPATATCLDPVFANENHTIVDARGNTVIVTETNPPVTRIDDPTDRLLATSTQIGNLPGVFLTGTTATAAGTQLQFRFAKSGRYLVVCMNRNHFLSNWMFGFINVVGDDDGHQ